MFNNYPYTDFHELNLDWFLAQFKELVTDWEDFHTTITNEWTEVQGEWASTQEAWTTLYNYVHNYFDNLDVQAEIDHKLDEMVADGTMETIVTPFLSQYGNDLRVLEARMDTFASLPDGSTAGNAELLDIRVGADGLTYASAGDAVRAQINNIQEPETGYNLMYTDVQPDNIIDPNTIIEGYYINNSGVPTASASWDCTDFIDISNYTELSAANIGLGAYYDINQNYLSSITLGNQQHVAIPATAAYIRCSILPADLSRAIISYHGFYDDPVENLPVSHWNITKKPFEDGYIPFTVPVNNTVATLNSTASDVNLEGVPNYVDVDCVLSLPINYKPVGRPCKLLMMCHGAGNGVSGAGNWTTNVYYNALVNMFTHYDYAVFDCNGFKNDTLGVSFWGNQRGVEAWRKAYQYIVDNYNVEKTFSIYAFSMGGLTAMNLAFQDFPNINAIAMGSPVLDLQKVFESTDGTTAVLQVLYGLGATWDESKVYGQNPWEHIKNINNQDICLHKLPPLKIWYGGAETGSAGNPALDKAIAQQFVQAVNNAGGFAQYREVQGGNHDISYGASSIVNTEILAFLERYEHTYETHNVIS